ncbi:MAG: hypothetical protein IPJ87_11075 [Flavobacteriales bacterium]|jgi:hypothetical protein|nr:hypothetical protein [Flavobacteriales bacterium]MBK7942396.1 hypothetical protein [Flavobacteriales bacterium]MBK8948212.1 hypothetical protein [Flavobacteriales bacterium]MBK9699202.1 hypothetical protein [Flavobacteriales bacterium]
MMLTHQAGCAARWQGIRPPCTAPCTTTTGAAFLNTFKGLMEEPALLLGMGAI